MISIDFSTLGSIDKSILLFANRGAHLDGVCELETTSIAFEENEDSHEEVKYLLRDFELLFINHIEDIDDKPDSHAWTPNNDGLQKLSESSIYIEYFEDFFHIRYISNSHVSHHITQLIHTYSSTK